MLLYLQNVWFTLADVIDCIPGDVVNVVGYVFCSIGVIGFFRSL